MTIAVRLVALVAGLAVAWAFLPSAVRLDQDVTPELPVNADEQSCDCEIHVSVAVSATAGLMSAIPSNTAYPIPPATPKSWRPARPAALLGAGDSTGPRCT